MQAEQYSSFNCLTKYNNKLINKEQFATENNNNLRRNAIRLSDTTGKVTQWKHFN